MRKRIKARARAKQKLIKAVIFTMALSIPAVVASVPNANKVSNDTALYQNLQELRISKESSIDFDKDIERLSAQEKSHRKALPLRVSAPMERVMKSPYKPSKSLNKKIESRRNADSKLDSL